MSKQTNPGLTWVGGNRNFDDLDETSQKILQATASGTSIFDPVLCELAYTWFTPTGAAILDPFAGGSVRGIVAAYLGRQYTGIDLRPEQIAANAEQGAAIVPDNIPNWIAGDSLEMDALLPEGAAFDFVFSCPPYADLEVYSDDPRDISTMTYEDFLTVYRQIIALAVARLRPDRFACFVVGDIRDKRGNYRDFVGDTVQAFRDAGCEFYNEAILVTAVGSLPIRVGRQFATGRKLGKTHQNVLVFVRGDGKKAAEFCGDVEIQPELVTT
jgi:DNA modification methylase